MSVAFSRELVRGDVKVFDFGLARTMPDDGSNYTEVYEMSGAGSPRYMVRYQDTDEIFLH